MAGFRAFFPPFGATVSRRCTDARASHRCGYRHCGRRTPQDHQRAPGPTLTSRKCDLDADCCFPGSHLPQSASRTLYPTRDSCELMGGVRARVLGGLTVGGLTGVGIGSSKDGTLLAALLLARGTPVRIDRLAAEQALDHDPYDELALRALLRAHVAVGRPAAALAAFVRFRTLLTDDSGADPSLESTQLTAATHQRARQRATAG